MSDPLPDTPEAPEPAAFERPLGAYATLMAAYATVVAGFGAWLRASGRELPERPAAGDLALIVAGTAKASRLLTKERVTSPVRAPFTEVDPGRGEGARAEVASGDGLRRALGELLGCPRCLSVWIATAFTAGLVVAPRQTRWIASGLATVLGSDFLQAAYRRAERSAEGSSGS